MSTLTDRRPLTSLSISALLTIDLHSLNNEGSEGNQLQARQVQIVVPDEHGRGKLHAVNAISGDMFKHMHAEHLHSIALDRNLPLCAGCQVFDANRINADPDFFANLTQTAGYATAKTASRTDSFILGEVIKHCVVDDLEGILITQEVDKKKRAIARKSVVEFGWVVGRPETTRTEAYFHVKYDPEGRAKGSSVAADTTGLNVGQNIFHRPASSGEYAVVANVDLYRISRNDITLDHVDLDSAARAVREAAVLESLVSAFVKPTGAHRNTQNPHIVGFQGAIALSHGSLPAPTVSALNLAYREEIDAVASALNRIRPGCIEVKGFDTPGQFAELMAGLIAATVS